MDLDTLQNQIGYYFNSIELLKNALVHRSYLNEKTKNSQIGSHNERLEFLGDAVLELVVTDYLYKTIEEAEGVLTSYRASLVNYKTMGEVGLKLNLGEHILMSKGEREEFDKTKLSIVADCFEAIIGAIYLDGGIEPCAKLISSHLIILLPDIIKNGTFKDSKSVMQEYCQKHTKITPKYRVISTEGKDHEKLFRIGVWAGQEKLGEGEGRSKQEAETKAADNALIVLQERFEVST